MAIIKNIIETRHTSKGAGKVVSDTENINKSQTRLAQTSASAGRSFAAQSQGLGGLVAAYAAAAATTFALQQAFDALARSARAAQTLEGLKTLATVSGESSTLLLNNIREITKNQLTLSETAANINLSLSSGFSSEQIEGLSEVALKASRALGRDLNDAYTRVVRGSAKLETELLDELGIFTKIGPATRAYADALGKSVTSLTEYERRQAFVNDVIEQGRQKFEAINTVVPTSAERLEAFATRIVDLATTAGKFLADTLAPLADFLTDNLPAGFAAAALAANLVFGKSLILLEEGLERITTWFSTTAPASIEKFVTSLDSKGKEIRNIAQATVQTTPVSYFDQLSKASTKELDSLIKLSEQRALNNAELTKARDLYLEIGESLQKRVPSLKKTAEIKENELANAEAALKTAKANKAAVIAKAEADVKAGKTNDINTKAVRDAEFAVNAQTKAVEEATRARAKANNSLSNTIAGTKALEVRINRLDTAINRSTSTLVKFGTILGSSFGSAIGFVGGATTAVLGLASKLVQLTTLATLFGTLLADNLGVLDEYNAFLKEIGVSIKNIFSSLAGLERTDFLNTLTSAGSVFLADLEKVDAQLRNISEFTFESDTFFGTFDITKTKEQLVKEVSSALTSAGDVAANNFTDSFFNSLTQKENIFASLFGFIALNTLGGITAALSGPAIIAALANPFVAAFAAVGAVAAVAFGRSFLNSSKEELERLNIQKELSARFEGTEISLSTAEAVRQLREQVGEAAQLSFEGAKYLQTQEALAVKLAGNLTFIERISELVEQTGLSFDYFLDRVSMAESGLDNVSTIVSEIEGIELSISLINEEAFLAEVAKVAELAKTEIAPASFFDIMLASIPGGGLLNLLFPEEKLVPEGAVQSVKEFSTAITAASISGQEANNSLLTAGVAVRNLSDNLTTGTITLEQYSQSIGNITSAIEVLPSAISRTEEQLEKSRNALEELQQSGASPEAIAQARELVGIQEELLTKLQEQLPLLNAQRDAVVEAGEPLLRQLRISEALNENYSDAIKFNTNLIGLFDAQGKLVSDTEQSERIRRDFLLQTVGAADSLRESYEQNKTIVNELLEDGKVTEAQAQRLLKIREDNREELEREVPAAARLTAFTSEQYQILTNANTALDIQVKQYIMLRQELSTATQQLEEQNKKLQERYNTALLEFEVTKAQNAARDEAFQFESKINSIRREQEQAQANINLLKAREVELAKATFDSRVSELNIQKQQIENAYSLRNIELETQKARASRNLRIGQELEQTITVDTNIEEVRKIYEFVYTTQKTLTDIQRQQSLDDYNRQLEIVENNRERLREEISFQESKLTAERDILNLEEQKARRDLELARLEIDKEISALQSQEAVLEAQKALQTNQLELEREKAFRDLEDVQKRFDLLTMQNAVNDRFIDRYKEIVEEQARIAGMEVSFSADFGNNLKDNLASAGEALRSAVEESSSRLESLYGTISDSGERVGGQLFANVEESFTSNSAERIAQLTKEREALTRLEETTTRIFEARRKALKESSSASTADLEQQLKNLDVEEARVQAAIEGLRVNNEVVNKSIQLLNTANNMVATERDKLTTLQQQTSALLLQNSLAEKQNKLTELQAFNSNFLKVNQALIEKSTARTNLQIEQIKNNSQELFDSEQARLDILRAQEEATNKLVQAQNNLRKVQLEQEQAALGREIESGRQVLKAAGAEEAATFIFDIVSAKRVQDLQLEVIAEREKQAQKEYQDQLDLLRIEEKSTLSKIEYINNRLRDEGKILELQQQLAVETRRQEQIRFNARNNEITAERGILEEQEAVQKSRVEADKKAALASIESRRAEAKLLETSFNKFIEANQNLKNILTAFLEDLKKIKGKEGIELTISGVELPEIPTAFSDALTELNETLDAQITEIGKQSEAQVSQITSEMESRTKVLNLEEKALNQVNDTRLAIIALEDRLAEEQSANTRAQLQRELDAARARLAVIHTERQTADTNHEARMTQIESERAALQSVSQMVRVQTEEINTLLENQVKQLQERYNQTAQELELLKAQNNVKQISVEYDAEIAGLRLEQELTQSRLNVFKAEEVDLAKTQLDYALAQIEVDKQQIENAYKLRQIELDNRRARATALQSVAQELEQGITVDSNVSEASEIYKAIFSTQRELLDIQYQESLDNYNRQLDILTKEEKSLAKRREYEEDRYVNEQKLLRDEKALALRDIELSQIQIDKEIATIRAQDKVLELQKNIQLTELRIEREKALNDLKNLQNHFNLEKMRKTINDIFIRQYREVVTAQGELADKEITFDVDTELDTMLQRASSSVSGAFGEAANAIQRMYGTLDEVTGNIVGGQLFDLVEQKFVSFSDERVKLLNKERGALDKIAEDTKKVYEARLTMAELEHSIAIENLSQNEENLAIEREVLKTARDRLNAHLGIVQEAIKFVNTAKQLEASEQNRLETLREQTNILRIQTNITRLQNELAIMQAQNAADIEVAQARSGDNSERINFQIEQIKNNTKEIYDNEVARLDILKEQESVALKLVQAQISLREAQLEAQKSSLGREIESGRQSLAALGAGEAITIVYDLVTAKRVQALELESIALREEQAREEYENQLRLLDLETQRVQAEISFIEQKLRDEERILELQQQISRGNAEIERQRKENRLAEITAERAILEEQRRLQLAQESAATRQALNEINIKKEEAKLLRASFESFRAANQDLKNILEEFVRDFAEVKLGLGKEEADRLDLRISGVKISDIPEEFNRTLNNVINTLNLSGEEISRQSEARTLQIVDNYAKESKLLDIEEDKLNKLIELGGQVSSLENQRAAAQSEQARAQLGRELEAARARLGNLLTEREVAETNHKTRLTQLDSERQALKNIFADIEAAVNIVGGFLVDTQTSKINQLKQDEASINSILSFSSQQLTEAKSELNAATQAEESAKRDLISATEDVVEKQKSYFKTLSQGTGNITQANYDLVKSVMSQADAGSKFGAAVRSRLGAEQQALTLEETQIEIQKSLEEVTDKRIKAEERLVKMQETIAAVSEVASGRLLNAITSISGAKSTSTGTEAATAAEGGGGLGIFQPIVSAFTDDIISPLTDAAKELFNGAELFSSSVESVPAGVYDDAILRQSRGLGVEGASSAGMTAGSVIGSAMGGAAVGSFIGELTGDTSYASTIGGAIGGVAGSVIAGSVASAAGVAAGAAIGSVVPVVGTIIGAALGGLIGGGLFGSDDYSKGQVTGRFGEEGYAEINRTRESVSEEAVNSIAKFNEIAFSGISNSLEGIGATFEKGVIDIETTVKRGELLVGMGRPTSREITPARTVTTTSENARSGEVTESTRYIPAEPAPMKKVLDKNYGEADAEAFEKALQDIEVTFFKLVKASEIAVDDFVPNSELLNRAINRFTKLPKAEKSEEKFNTYVQFAQNFDSAIAELKGPVNGMNEAIRRVGKGAKEAAYAQVNQLNDVIENTAEVFGKGSNQARRANNAVRENTLSILGLERAANGSLQPLGAAQKNLSGLKLAIKGVDVTAEAYREQLKNLTKANGEVLFSTKEINEVLREYSRTQKREFKESLIESVEAFSAGANSTVLALDNLRDTSKAFRRDINAAVSEGLISQNKALKLQEDRLKGYRERRKNIIESANNEELKIIIQTSERAQEVRMAERELLNNLMEELSQTGSSLYSEYQQLSGNVSQALNNIGNSFISLIDSLKSQADSATNDIVSYYDNLVSERKKALEKAGLAEDFDLSSAQNEMERIRTVLSSLDVSTYAGQIQRGVLESRLYGLGKDIEAYNSAEVAQTTNKLAQANQRLASEGININQLRNQEADNLQKLYDSIDTYNSVLSETSQLSAFASSNNKVLKESLENLGYSASEISNIINNINTGNLSNINTQLAQFDSTALIQSYNIAKDNLTDFTTSLERAGTSIGEIYAAISIEEINTKNENIRKFVDSLNSVQEIDTDFNLLDTLLGSFDVSSIDEAQQQQILNGIVGYDIADLRQLVNKPVVDALSETQRNNLLSNIAGIDVAGFTTIAEFVDSSSFRSLEQKDKVNLVRNFSGLNVAQFSDITEFVDSTSFRNLEDTDKVNLVKHFSNLNVTQFSDIAKFVDSPKFRNLEDIDKLNLVRNFSGLNVSQFSDIIDFVDSPKFRSLEYKDKVNLLRNFSGLNVAQFKGVANFVDSPKFRNLEYRDKVNLLRNFSGLNVAQFKGIANFVDSPKFRSLKYKDKVNLLRNFSGLNVTQFSDIAEFVDSPKFRSLEYRDKVNLLRNFSGLNVAQFKGVANFVDSPKFRNLEYKDKVNIVKHFSGINLTELKSLAKSFNNTESSSIDNFISSVLGIGSTANSSLAATNDLASSLELTSTSTGVTTSAIGSLNTSMSNLSGSSNTTDSGIANLRSEIVNLGRVAANNQQNIIDFRMKIAHLGEVANNNEINLVNFRMKIAHLGEVANNNEINLVNFRTNIANLGTEATNNQQNIIDFRTKIANLGTVATNNQQKIIDFKDKISDVVDVFNSLNNNKINKLSNAINLLNASNSENTRANRFGIEPDGGDPNFSSGGVIKAASGTYVQGDGTSVSDSIPALLSRGEYVVNAAAVRELGLPYMEAINRGMELRPVELNQQNQEAPEVNVNIINNGTPQQADSTQVRRENGKIVVDVILEDIRNNGPIKRSIRSMR